MRVSQAIELLKELPPDALICAQWYDKEDMTPSGIDSEITMTDEIWELAHSIFNNYEFPDMHYAVEQAIDEAKKQLGITNE